MKKITKIIAVFLAVLSISFAPAAVQAQVVEEVNPDPTAATTPLPSTGGSEVQAPDTGIAPSNRVAQNAAVFIGGSLLGAGIGFGIVTLRKKQLEDQ